jgi:hypothetical protein
MRIILVVFAALVLAGCYISKTPFITSTSADYPIADGARFNAFAPAGAKWLARPRRTIRRAGAWYVYQEDGRPKPSLPFLLKRVAPNLYVVQMNDRPPPKAPTEYTYQLIEFDGTTAIQYAGLCPARPDWVARKLVARIEETQTRRCIFSSFEHLITVLREAKRHTAPEARYVLIRR